MREINMPVQGEPVTDRDAFHGWSSRTAFILGAIGSAIGIGNIWRFPFVCYENGGGAFLLAYLIALFTAGIPLLLLEMGLGHKTLSGPPRAYGSIKKPLEWLGWMAVLVGFVLVCYYTVIMSWCANYLVFSFDLKWGKDTADFFNKFLNKSDPSNIFNLGSIVPGILIGLVVMWVWNVLSIWKGARTVSKVVYVTVLLPWLILIIFVIRGVTLPGAFEGLKYYLTPDFSRLLEPKVWIAAYGQVFFSISAGFGIMIVYASFLPAKSDITNNVFIIALADSATAFVGGIAVFSGIGFLCHQTGCSITEIKGGPGLVFVTYPTIINQFPLAPQLFGILFFVMLLTLAVDSAFSLLETVVTGVMDKWNISRPKANILCASIALLCGIVFTTQAGLYWLDIVDKFNTNFVLIIVGILEALVIAYILGTKKIREHVNETSDFRIGVWWDWFIRIVTPAVLIIGLGLTIYSTIKAGKPYGEYQSSAVFLAGWGLLIVLPIIALILTVLKGKKPLHRTEELKD
ncbi:MAG: sodium-dependent transporter [Planctomycetota bacterium]|nr:sodium-dependent transporter [Planctomycetota bacterium]